MFSDIEKILNDPNHPDHRQITSIIKSFRGNDYEKTQEIINTFHKTRDSIADWHDYIEQNPPSSASIALLIIMAVDEYNSKKSSNAANERHKKSGFKEKQNEIQKIWLSGKYSTKDRCAEEEYAALGLSFSTARKALRNLD